MKIESVPIKNIKTAAYNPRVMRSDEFEGLKASLKEFGQQENFIVNDDMTLISGHQRLEAAKQLGWTEVVCSIVKLDKKQEKKLNIVMNNRSIQGSFDELKLSELLEELKFDDNYIDLRLDTLEPLDLSDIEFDGASMSDEETYRNQSIKQIVLAYGIEEFEEIMKMVNELIGTGEYGNNPTELFSTFVKGVYADLNSKKA